MFETKRVTVNEATSTLLAKGPCRCRIESATSSSQVFMVGEQSVTALTGFKSGSAVLQQELCLGTGERVFAISDTGQGTFDVMVMTYGSP